MKNNDEKIIIFNMHCDVHYYPTRFEIRVELVYGEIKKINYIIGLNELSCIF